MILLSLSIFLPVVLEQINATQSIQSILAPAIMISSCGLIMLGLNNKYSSVIGRIRLLNNERRKIVAILTSENNLDYSDNMRLRSLQTQINQLLKRCKLVRNSVTSIALAIGLFVFTCLLLAMSYLTKSDIFDLFAMIVFILGMFSVFLGVILVVIEVRMAYRIALIDVKAEE
jgi:hypothetical protein